MSKNKEKRKKTISPLSLGPHPPDPLLAILEDPIQGPYFVTLFKVTLHYNPSIILSGATLPLQALFFNSSCCFSSFTAEKTEARGETLRNSA